MKKLRLHSAVLGAAFALCFSVQVLAADHFYRIIDGPNPGPAQAAIDRYVYGTEVLYTGDATAHPTRVEGTVWHSNLKEAQYFVGTRNPVIAQGSLFALIENNKWEEAKLLMEYAPDAFPRTENLATLIKTLRLDGTASESRLLTLLSQALRERYPDGFFLKPVAGFNAVGTFPTEKSDFASVYEAYLRDVKPVIQRRLAETHGDTDTVHLELKGLPNYSGRVLEDLLARPKTVIVQAKIQAAVGSWLHTPEGRKPLLAEYRVHVVEGKVLKGATQTRWEDARAVSEEAFARVDAFAQSVIDRLPPAMRKMCFGMDVMQTRNGLYQVIELNPGGESGYLYPDTDVWVTQLLAARYHGGHTELLDEFKRFSEAPSLDAKEAALEKLLRRPELQSLTAQIEPVTELLAHAKTVILAELEKAPTRESAMDVLMSLKKFRLEPYLTSAEIERLANLINDAGTLQAAGIRLENLSDALGLDEGEILFVGSAGEIRLLAGLGYGDVEVEDAMLARLRERLRGMDHLSDAKARDEASKLASEQVATREELASGSIGRQLLARELTVTRSPRIFYSGTREALIRTLVRRLLLSEAAEL